MKIISNIISVLLIVVGVIWFLQGINVLLGSVMTGQSQWAIFGVIAFLLGLVLLLFVNRKKSSPPQSN